MKKVIITSLIVVMVLSLGVAFAGPKGNGAPSGPHFNLNLIGVKDDHPKNMEDCDSGHRIFVKLGNKKKGNAITSTTRIYLASCEDVLEEPGCMEFGVLDCDGTDGEAAFMLPNPDPGDGSNCTRYSVWARPLGSPKNNPYVKITTCGEPCIAWDTAGNCTDVGPEVCSTEYVELTRTKGNKIFKDFSRELLTTCVWVWDGDSWELERRYLFDDMFENYLWKYENTGVKLVQLRFYYEPSCWGEDWVCRDMDDVGPPADPQ